MPSARDVDDNDRRFTVRAISDALSHELFTDEGFAALTLY